MTTWLRALGARLNELVEILDPPPPHEVLSARVARLEALLSRQLQHGDSPAAKDIGQDNPA